MVDITKRSNCPKCKQEISKLIYSSRVEVTQDYDGEYGSIADYGNHYNEEYSCPLCYKTLTTDEEEADEILGLRR